MISYAAQTAPEQQQLNFVDGDKYKPISIDVYTDINNYPKHSIYQIQPYIKELIDTKKLIDRRLELMRRYPQFHKANEYSFNHHMREARVWMNKLEPFLLSKLKSVG